MGRNGKLVAPSRVRGLKPLYRKLKQTLRSRILTGAWIETWLKYSFSAVFSGRTLTGAWIET
ncbi:hypothetical protein HMPREF3039_02385, partial [Akkermansia sp. KLE1798]